MNNMNAQSGGTNRRILIIDDNPSIHADFKKILCGNGDQGDLAQAETELFGDAPTAAGKRTYELTSAFQGQEGLEAVRQVMHDGKPFAMAFVDVRMPPGWDGIETVARIWEVDPDVQIVICTAYSDYSWEEMTACLGTSDRLVILKKPFDMIEVLQLANAFTEKWMLLQQSRSQMRFLEETVAGRTRELESANELLRKEIIERQHTEQALRTAQEKLNHILRKSPAVIYSLRFQGDRFIPSWVTENFVTLTGCQVETWYQQTPELGYVELTDRADARARMETILEREFVTVEYRVYHKDGRLRWIRDERQLLRDSDGTPVEIVGCWTDITNQRQLEDQLRQAQKMESVGQLAGGIAHDFNNLLMVILGHVELLLKDEQLHERVVESLLRIQSASDRAGNLTRQLLAFSRKQIMRPRLLNLNELIESMARLLGRTLGEHIAIQTQQEPSLPAVTADPAMIEQVVMNLAVNARDAMSDGGQLIIRTTAQKVDGSHKARSPDSQPGRYVCVSVTDTGCGIAAEHLPRVFEPFFTTKEVGKGTGLGLSTVYGNIKQHGGWVEVDSREGHGTTVKVYLPATGEAPAPKAVRASRTVRGGQETILVVEDEPALRSLINIVLRRQGYQVHTAPSGAEALGAWAGRLDEIQLLITDIVMPDGLSGWELAKELQSVKPSLKVIYMSGYNTEMAGGKPVTENVWFLEKPFQPQRLIEAVRDCLDEVPPQGAKPASADEEVSQS